MFAECAARLAGLAGALLGWRPHEFWAATPDELMAIIAAMLPRADTPDAALIDQLKDMFPDG